MGLRYCNSYKESWQAFRRESGRCVSQCIPSTNNLWGCCLNHCTTVPTGVCPTWMCIFWGLSLQIQRWENHEVISWGCMQGVSALPITEHSVYPEIGGPPGERHCHGTWQCSQWVYPVVCSWSSYAAFEMSEVLLCIYCVVTWFEVQKQGSCNVPLALCGQVHHLVWHV